MIRDPRAFMLAGNARVTLVSRKTGVRFTYKIRQPDPSKPHFVSLLVGADNDRDYAYLGTIFDARTYRAGKRSRITPDASSAKAFAWAWAQIVAGTIPADLEVCHEGRCGRCGRALTVPESIASGFGPECIQHVAA